ncbi:MAG TPA: hypothetical protein VNV66_05115 [Pilimelia sp.]|nr:hypothetical protein [Pilimelia sp.]
MSVSEYGGGEILLRWLPFLLGNILTIATFCLLGAVVGTMVRGGAWLRQAAAVLLVGAGGLAAVHAARERQHWTLSYDDRADPILTAVHAAWRSTVGVTSPRAFTIATAIAFAVLLVLLLRRRRGSGTVGWQRRGAPVPRRTSEYS